MVQTRIHRRILQTRLPSQTQFTNALAGDMYYTVGTEGHFMAVNLTSKMVQWSTMFDTEEFVKAIAGVPATGDVVVSSDETTYSFSGGGILNWETQAFVLPQPQVGDVKQWTIVGTTLYSGDAGLTRPDHRPCDQQRTQQRVRRQHCI